MCVHAMDEELYLAPQLHGFGPRALTLATIKIGAGRCISQYLHLQKELILAHTYAGRGTFSFLHLHTGH
jgi:hypothetical protein